MSDDEHAADAEVIEPASTPISIKHTTRKRKHDPMVIALGVVCVAPLVILVGWLTIRDVVKAATPSKSVAKTQLKKEVVDVYAAVDDLVCATDNDFLDSSPLVSPANFARVDKGTEVYMVDIGGMFSGKMYYGLSAGGRVRIYIYRNAFEQKFKKVRSIEK